MPSAVTDWGTGQFLNIILNLDSQPAVMYVALCADEPGESADGDTIEELEPPPELGYARQPIPMDLDNWEDPTDGSYTTNINPVEFGVPLDYWGTMTHFALCDSATSGNIYLYGEFDLPADVDGTYDFFIPAGGLVISFGSLQSSIVSL